METAAKEMRLIADAMLGRLARWLRLIGFDVLYFKDIEDSALIKIAREQGRTILTRDSHFLKQKAFKDYIFSNLMNCAISFWRSGTGWISGVCGCLQDVLSAMDCLISYPLKKILRERYLTLYITMSMISKNAGTVVRFTGKGHTCTRLKGGFRIS